MSELATAYVQIVPDMSGIQDALAGAFSDAADNGSDGGSKAGQAFSKAFGIAAKAIGEAFSFVADSVGVASGFESAMSQVAATMGFTVDELNTAGSEAALTFETLSAFAQEMGSTTAFSASEAADALNYMALAGYDAETSMEMLPNVLNLAAAGGIGLAEASDMVTDASSALGLSLDETALLVDKMAKASSKSNTSVQQLGDAILTVGGTAKNLAGGTTELSAALGILADNGIKGSEGGTALRNIILSLAAPTDNAYAKMKQLGLEVYDAAGKMRPLEDIFTDLNGTLSEMTQGEQTEALSVLFNKVDLKSANALLATNAERWAELSDAIDGAWFSVDGITAGFDAIGYDIDFDKFVNGFHAIGISTEMVDSALKASGGNAEAFADALFELADGGATYEQIMRAIPTDLNELQMAFDSTSGAAQAMADVQLDNLEGSITLFKSALEGAQIAIGEGLTPVLKDFVDYGAEGLSTLTAAFKEGGIEGAMEALGPILEKGIGMITEMLPNFLSLGSTIILSLVQGITDNLPTLISAGADALITISTGLIEHLPDLITAGLEVIVTLANGIAEALPELIPTIVEVVLEIVDTLTNPDTLSSLIDAAIAIIIALANGLIAALPQLIAKAPEIIANLVTAIIQNVPKLLAAAVEIIVTLVKGIGENLGQILSAAGEIITTVFNGIVSLASDLWEAGKSIVSGIWEGIKNTADWLWNQVKGFFSNVLQKIKDFLGIASPSKVFAEMGENMALGIGVGIEAETGAVEKAVGDMAAAAVGAWNADQLDTELAVRGSYGFSGRGGQLASGTSPQDTADIISAVMAVGNMIVAAVQAIDPDIQLDGASLANKLLPYSKAENKRVGAAMVI